MINDQTRNSPSLDVDQLTASTYEAVAHKFAETRCGKGQWPEFSYLLPYINSGDTLLDIGCGSGRLLHYLEQQHVHLTSYVGIDQSKELLKEAITRARPLHIPHVFHLSSMLDMGGHWKDSMFDTICSIAAFHHLSTVEQRIQVLSIIAQAMHAESRCLMLNWNILRDHRKKGVRPCDDDNFLVPFHHNEVMYERLYHQFSEQEWSQLLLQSGLFIEDAFSVVDGLRHHDPYLGYNAVHILRKM